jgi:hypothetical protein
MWVIPWIKYQFSNIHIINIVSTQGDINLLWIRYLVGICDDRLGYITTPNNDNQLKEQCIAHGIVFVLSTATKFNDVFSGDQWRQYVIIIYSDQVPSPVYHSLMMQTVRVPELQNFISYHHEVTSFLEQKPAHRRVCTLSALLCKSTCRLHLCWHNIATRRQKWLPFHTKRERVSPLSSSISVNEVSASVFTAIIELSVPWPVLVECQLSLKGYLYQ